VFLTRAAREVCDKRRALLTCRLEAARVLAAAWRDELAVGRAGGFCSAFCLTVAVPRVDALRRVLVAWVLRRC